MSRTISERVIAPVAIGSIGLATVLAAVGTWVGPDEQGSKEFLVICAIIAVAAAVGSAGSFRGACSGRQRGRPH